MICFLESDGYIAKNKTWSLEQCGPAIQIISPITRKGIHGLEMCKETCDNNTDCTAIEFTETAANHDNACVLKKCPYPVPEPDLDWYDFTGYVKGMKTHTKQKF